MCRLSENYYFFFWQILPTPSVFNKMNGRGEKCLKLALAKKIPGIGLEQVSNDADTGNL